MEGLTDLRRAWEALRDAQDRAYGPNKRIVHVGRCGAELNALMDAVEATLFVDPASKPCYYTNARELAPIRTEKR